MLIGTDDIGSCLDQIYIAVCIGKNETGSYHDHFDVLYGFEQMIVDDVLT
jgi:hypothetical protein